MTIAHDWLQAIRCTFALFILWRLIRFFHLRKTRETFLWLVSFTILLAGIQLDILSIPYWLKVKRFLLGSALLWVVLDPEISALRVREKFKRYRKFLERGGPLDELVKTCQALSCAKMGGLIAIERNDPLESYAEKGVSIDAIVKSELLMTIFTPPKTLHDGGVIIANDRILACSSIFPLTQNPRLPKDLGTRHRAALGLSEQTDAICLVVSEETGLLSITDRGELIYDFPLRDLRSSVEKLLYFKKVKKGKVIA